jgi:hypothetical protein
MGLPFSLALNRDYKFEFSERFAQLAGISNIELYDLSPIEIKNLYVFGLLEDIFSSVSCLLQQKDAWPKRYLPAFGLFSSAMDLLGRCLNGNSSHWQKHDLTTGFQYLFSPSQDINTICIIDYRKEIFRTNHRGYSINDLQDLRNYSLHGQATVKGDLPPFDIELLDGMPRRMGNAISVYWNCLKTSIPFCERLAHARISLYRDRAEPLASIINILNKGTTISEIFTNMDWQVYK